MMSLRLGELADLVRERERGGEALGQERRAEAA